MMRNHAGDTPLCTSGEGEGELLALRSSPRAFLELRPDPLNQPNLMALLTCCVACCLRGQLARAGLPMLIALLKWEPLGGSVASADRAWCYPTASLCQGCQSLYGFV